MTSGVFHYPRMERVVYGRPFAAAVANEAAVRGAERVFVLSGRTLAERTDALRQLGSALGSRAREVFVGIGAHTPRSDVVAATAAARKVRADLIVTLGGGSITDAGKMVALCLANDVTSVEQFDALHTAVGPGGAPKPPVMVAAPELPVIAVPTTLSAGEFTAFAGCTDPARGAKDSYRHPLLAPRAAILDPAVTVHTPDWLWLSTGIRALDHAVEDLCSINGHPLSDAASLHALRLLAAGLPAARHDGGDLAARLDALVGAWLSIVGSQAGVDKGASHGIGHVLGAVAGVPHGYTSCVMLPHVLRYNAAVNAERQSAVSDALGGGGTPAADVVAALVHQLGLPGRLRDVGVREDQLDRVAEGAMHDRWIHTNPRPIAEVADVRLLLQSAW